MKTFEEAISSAEGAMKVSAVVVSRMDRPIGAVLDSIIPHVEELIVVRGHKGVWERWEAAARAKCDVVYTQDDDAIVDVPEVLAAYKPGLVTCNMPQDRRSAYQDGIALVGWGAVFSKKTVTYMVTTSRCQLPPFCRYAVWWGLKQTGGPPCLWSEDAIFRRECDRVFTGLSELQLIDVPVQHMPWANGDDRMCRRAHDPVHGQYLQEIRRRIYAARGLK